MRMLDQNSNCTNTSALAGNPHFNNTLLGSHMPANLSSGIGSVASTLSTQQHATSGDRLDASSDSAVSSMGSERVASLSDGEWNEAGSDSAQEYHS
jgi:nuclear factor erythroid 2